MSNLHAISINDNLKFYIEIFYIYSNVGSLYSNSVIVIIETITNIKIIIL